VLTSVCRIRQRQAIAVISRFTDSLKARITALQARQRREGKRVWPTTLRFVWAREFGEIKGKKHYHAVLLLNRDTWCGPGITGPGFACRYD
jgi:hypothetical protein